MGKPSTSVEDLCGIEHSKLGFFQELRQKVEELKSSHKRSEDQRREISALLDAITDVMMVLSEDLHIISVNHVFRDLFPGVELEGKYCYEIFRGEDHPCPECPAFRSLSTDSVCRGTAIFRIGDRNRHFEMVSSPLKNPEWPKHRVLIFKRDVTVEKDYQAKYYQSEKIATIGMLAAGVAHEINNPLAAVAGFAEGIKRRLPRIQENIDQEMAADLEEYTDIILKECLRCQDIVRTLLTFSRSSSAFSPVSLSRVVNDTLRLLQNQLKQHSKISLQVESEPNLPMVFGEESQLKQVVLNLMTNAMHAITGEGQILIRIYTGPNRRVFLEIRDTGCGIPAENMDKLFEPFFTTKPVGRGIGIGLSTCYTIVQEHNGTIGVQSEPGKGTSFVVNLPPYEGDVSEYQV